MPILCDDSFRCKSKYDGGPFGPLKRETYLLHAGYIF